ncbi:KH domain-containing protein akap-1-like isoform X2 [Penaeus japonicus]|uniref:KH domain-containing protein akap-1-like isoform X2 n=1 Tax=Penaeus japonicus TaxID=27405 RepID=UPI001C70DFD2|nr:KH domain-containing protein akap-1-like isoform X2 [Penaeus japonicus]
MYFLWGMKVALGAAAAITGASALIYIILRSRKWQTEPGNKDVPSPRHKVDTLDKVSSHEKSDLHVGRETEPHKESKDQQEKNNYISYKSLNGHVPADDNSDLSVDDFAPRNESFIDGEEINTEVKSDKFGLPEETACNTVSENKDICSESTVDVDMLTSCIVTLNGPSCLSDACLQEEEKLVPVNDELKLKDNKDDVDGNNECIIHPKENEVAEYLESAKPNSTDLPGSSTNSILESSTTHVPQEAVVSEKEADQACQQDDNYSNDRDMQEDIVHVTKMCLKEAMPEDQEVPTLAEGEVNKSDMSPSTNIESQIITSMLCIDKAAISNDIGKVQKSEPSFSKTQNEEVLSEVQGKAKEELSLTLPTSALEKIRSVPVAESKTKDDRIEPLKLKENIVDVSSHSSIETTQDDSCEEGVVEKVELNCTEKASKLEQDDGIQQDITTVEVESGVTQETSGNPLVTKENHVEETVLVNGIEGTTCDSTNSIQQDVDVKTEVPDKTAEVIPNITSKVIPNETAEVIPNITSEVIPSVTAEVMPAVDAVPDCNDKQILNWAAEVQEEIAREKAELHTTELEAKLPVCKVKVAEAPPNSTEQKSNKKNNPISSSKDNSKHGSTKRPVKEASEKSRRRRGGKQAPKQNEVPLESCANNNVSDTKENLQCVAVDSATTCVENYPISEPDSHNCDSQSLKSIDSGQGSIEVEPETVFNPSACPVFSQEQFLFYEFEIPQTLVGRLIGRKGAFVNKIKATTDATLIVYPHKNRRLKLCSVEGTRQQVDAAIRMIRDHFPLDRYPDVTLEQVSGKAPAQPAVQPTVNTQAMQIELTAGVVVEVRVSSVMSGGELWVQQPLHPSFSALQRLHSCMNLNYGDGSNTPPLPQPIHEGTVCVGHVARQWMRCQVLSCTEETAMAVLLDVGGVLALPTSDLRQIRYDYMTLPFQASQCLLHGIQPVKEGWDDTSAAVLEELVSGTILFTTVVSYTEDGVPLVNLYRRQQEQYINLNEKMVHLGHAKWIAPPTAS